MNLNKIDGVCILVVKNSALTFCQSVVMFNMPIPFNNSIVFNYYLDATLATHSKFYSLALGLHFFNFANQSFTNLLSQVAARLGQAVLFFINHPNSCH